MSDSSDVSGLRGRSARTRVGGTMLWRRVGGARRATRSAVLCGLGVSAVLPDDRCESGGMGRRAGLRIQSRKG
jgi:hypothetical protein